MIFWEVCGAIFGLMIIGAWYMETYLDTTFSSNSRIVTSRMSSSARSQATTRPLVGLGFFICSLGEAISELSSYYIVTGILIVTGLLCFLSLPSIILPLIRSPLDRRSIPVHEAPWHAGRERRPFAADVFRRGRRGIR